ncbi:hypothetical protein Gasu2_09430 [Galdieria sulphuraria]|nr:hypothetical protein Gasu2_09430 [Galdieria sulphuraria]
MEPDQSTSSDLLDQFEKEESSDSIWKTSSDSCLTYFDQMSFCLSPANQFRYYYTYGLADTCDTQVDDFWRCIRWKLKGTSPPTTNEEKQPHVVPKREHLWTFRDTPPEV